MASTGFEPMIPGENTDNQPLTKFLPSLFAL